MEQNNGVIYYRFSTDKISDADAEIEEQGLNRAIEESQLGTILDISDITFISKEGLNLLIKSHDRAKQLGRTFAITGIEHDQVREVFNYTQMSRYLNTYSTIEEAEKSFQQ